MERRRLLVEDEGEVRVLTLDHPEKRNALSQPMLTELRAALDAAATDRAVRAVLLRARGPVFSSGHDLGEIARQGEVEQRALFALCTEVMERLPNLPQPVVAEVHALATAAGCQLVASCDLVVASEAARFATPGVRIGLFCTTPGVALARAVWPRKALEMLLTGRAIDAHEAQAAGLVTRVVPAERLHEEALGLAREVIQASADTLARGKRAFYEQLRLDRVGAYVLAQKAMVENAQTDDAQEGMRAFLEKRPPRWRS
jgi:enoyl-CoA hydratase/carnithine racemase